VNAPAPPVQLFLDDDRAYLAWLATNLHGWVINAYRIPDDRYLILHKATCHTITGIPARGSTWTGGQFSKICGTSVAGITEWCLLHAGGQPIRCGRCNSAPV
jgi:hypothetical protein